MTKNSLDGCSCHNNPPCSYCVSRTCSNCDHSEDIDGSVAMLCRKLDIAVEDNDGTAIDCEYYE